MIEEVQEQKAADYSQYRMPEEEIDRMIDYWGLDQD